ncbi:MAG: site-2 protease family protein [Aureliella sp.]
MREPRRDSSHVEVDSVLRIRTELHATKYHDRQTGKARWVIFDPFSRRSFRIGDREYRLAQLCDGVAKLGEIISRCCSEQSLAVQSDHQQASEFAASLMHDFRRLAIVGILTPVNQRTTTRGTVLHSNSPQESPASPRSIAKLLSSAVVWRLPGLNLDRQLSRLVTVTNWLYSTSAVRCWLVICILAAIMAGLNFQNLPQIGQLWSWIATPSKTGMLFVIFVLTRAAHELGHAVVCKRFGIRCPDMGFLIIVGTPCMYCDVSESWRLPQRWKRAAIAAAGMYTECIIASLAAFLWLNTSGPVSELALQTATICSISTILINANPLMRFDGYHILADWLDEPSLRAKSDEVSYSTARRWIAGIPIHNSTAATADPEHAEGPVKSGPRFWPLPARYRWFLSTFSIASWVYRGMLTIAIATAIVTIYSRWQLSWVGRGLAAGVLLSMWGGSLMTFVRALFRDSKTLPQRTRVVLFVAMIALAALLFPLPQRCKSLGWIQSSESHAVFALASGRLERCFVNDGDSVRQGDPLFELSGPEAEMSLLKLSSSAELATLKAEQLRRERDHYGQDLDLSEAQARIESAKQLAFNAKKATEQLGLQANGSGIFIAAMSSAASADLIPSSTWTEADQIGRRVEQGTRLGTIISGKPIAILPLTPDSLDRVQEGDVVHVRIAGGTQVIRSEIEKIVPLNQMSGPERIAGHQSAKAATDIESNSISPSFAAIVHLGTAAKITNHSTATGVFHLQPLTLFAMVQRWVYGNGNLLAD